MRKTGILFDINYELKKRYQSSEMTKVDKNDSNKRVHTQIRKMKTYNCNEKMMFANEENVSI